MAFVHGVNWYNNETDGNINVRIKRLESVIDTVFYRNCRGGDAFTELALHGQKT
jgi:hypothetical protein